MILDHLWYDGDLDHDSVHLLRVHRIVPNNFERPIAPRECITLLWFQRLGAETERQTARDLKDDREFLSGFRSSFWWSLYDRYLCLWCSRWHVVRGLWLYMFTIFSWNMSSVVRSAAQFFAFFAKTKDGHAKDFSRKMTCEKFAKKCPKRVGFFIL